MTLQRVLRSVGEMATTCESVVPATRRPRCTSQGDTIVPGERTRCVTSPSAAITRYRESTVATTTAPQPTLRGDPGHPHAPSPAK